MGIIRGVRRSGGRLSGAWLAVLGCALWGSGVADEGTLAREVTFDIPAQRLTSAIVQFSEQTQVQVIASGHVVTDQTTAGVSGRHTIAQGLKLLLQGTGLKYKALNENTVALQAGEPLAAVGSGAAGVVSSGSGIGSGEVVGASGRAVASTTLEEVIVTAQKREERLQDVPVPVTAVSIEALLQNNQIRLQDWYSQVPGLNITTDDFGTPLITIRGLTTGSYTNPTVGFVVDDVPIGSSSALANGQQVPDIDPNDLARIEVLRGPQGTLYGASTLGGLIKFVTADPSSDAFSGRVQAGTDSVYNGGQLGYSVRGSVNVPLTDTIAVRASAFVRQEAGYVDNIETGENGVNWVESYGARLAGLWRPMESFSVKLSAVLQDNVLHGSSYVDLPVNGYAGPALADLQQYDLRNTGWLRQSMRLFTANIRAGLGGIDVVSLTGYSVNAIADSFDGTSFYGGLGQAIFGVTGSPLITDNRTYKLTEELRLSGSVGSFLDWLAGGFYNHENSPGYQDIAAVDPASGVVAGDGLHYSNPTTFEEYAGFADLTFHVTDRVAVQIGGRESENRQTLTERITGPYVPYVYPGATSPLSYPLVRSSDNSFTYLLTPQFKITPDLMLYARLASGYRPGGPNADVGNSVPLTFQPDKTQNYEIGLKGDALSQMLSFDLSLYRINWKNIQLFLIDSTTGTAYNANGSRAKSQGAELSITARPQPSLVISGWVALNDAALTEPFPSSATVQGASGDRLPYSSRLSGNVSVADEFPLVDALKAVAGIDLSYVGDREGIFTAVPPRQDFPGYAKTDLHVGVKRDSWLATLYVNNVTDRRGVLNGGIGTFLPYAFEYIQPRTVGVSLVDKF